MFFEYYMNVFSTEKPCRDILSKIFKELLRQIRFRYIIWLIHN